MLYSEYISKAKSICIAVNETNNTAYLSPDYRYILHLAGMNLTDVSDFPGVTMDVVGENLKLEAEAYNKRYENVRSFIDNIEEFIASIVVPLQETDQNEIIKLLLEKAQSINEGKNKHTAEQEENISNKNNSIIQMQIT